MTYGQIWRWMRLASVEEVLGVGVRFVAALFAVGVRGFSVCYFLLKYPVPGLYLIDLIWASFPD